MKVEENVKQSCIFCQLVRRELPLSVVAETDDVMAVMDIQPINPGHVLVIPKAHAQYLADLDRVMAAHIFAMGLEIAAAVRESGVRCEGVNLFLADGEAAGQEVIHVHLHIIPRFSGDGFGLKFGPNYSHLPPKSELDQVATKIRQSLKPN